MSTKQKIKQWNDIGWQGLVFPVPDTWHLASVHGSREKGYMRFDDDERVRMELRWEKPQKRPAEFDLMAGSMLAMLEKVCRKKISGFSIIRHQNFASPEGREFECFEAKGGSVSFGLVTRCTTCGRIIIGRVLGTAKEDVPGLARRIFEGMKDHPDEAGLDHWKVYGLDCKIPQDYFLQNTKMRTGALELLFAKGRREIDVHRISLADLLLKDNTLRSFFINFCFKDLRWFQYETADVEIPHVGHTGIGLTGPQSLKGRVMSHGGTRRFIHACAWKCDDRIFIFKMKSPLAEDPQFFELMQHLRCHEETEGQ